MKDSKKEHGARKEIRVCLVLSSAHVDYPRKPKLALLSRERAGSTKTRNTVVVVPDYLGKL
jgi:hypothetical protein